MSWLRTNGVNANGAAAKVMNSDWLGKNVRHGTFGKIKVGERECPKSPSVENLKFAVTPLVLTPFVPFRKPLYYHHYQYYRYLYRYHYHRQ